MPHPSRAIRSVRSRHLEGRRIILGVSGSIAAIEAPRIARELIRHGADVTAVMSREAARIVTPEALAFATGHPAITELSGDVEHVTLLGPGEGQGDLLLIAPATANTLGKIAHGIDDTPVTSCASVALGGGVPILVAPAMHGHMAENPAVRENLRRLVAWGVGVIEPLRAEGEEKIAPPEEIAAGVVHRLARGAWVGRELIVIGGASREPIDAVRSVTNESSGTTAVALAVEGHLRGAEVMLWAGALQVPVPRFVPVVRWHRVGELLELVSSRGAELRRASAVLVPAALSDFTLDPAEGKIESRRTDRLELRLRRAPKVLPELRRGIGADTRLVGFKLEAVPDAASLAAPAEALLHEHSLDAVVANRAETLGSREAEVLWIDARGARQRLQGSKEEVARGILDLLGLMLGEKAGSGPAPAPTPAASRTSRGGEPGGPGHRARLRRRSSSRRP